MGRYGMELLQAKAFICFSTDVKLRKRKEQKGLETPVVYAVNYEWESLHTYS